MPIEIPSQTQRLFESPFTIETIENLPYSEFLSKQNAFMERSLELIQKNQEPQQRLLFCQHPLVMTSGISTKNVEKTLGTSVAAKIGAEFYEIDRGGKLALHGPGQLMIYPWCFLPHPRAISDWTQKLLEVSKKTLQALYPHLKFTENPAFHAKTADGLYTENGKILFCGIRIKKVATKERSLGVSTHGLAINFTNEFAHYDLFPSCGIQGRALDQVGKQIDLEFFAKTWAELFKS